MAQSILENGDSSCWNEEPCPFPKGDNNEVAKVKFFSRNTGPLYNQTWQKSSLGKGNFMFKRANEGLCPLPRGDNNEVVKIH